MGTSIHGNSQVREQQVFEFGVCEVAGDGLRGCDGLPGLIIRFEVGHNCFDRCLSGHDGRAAPG